MYKAASVAGHVRIRIGGSDTACLNGSVDAQHLCGQEQILLASFERKLEYLSDGKFPGTRYEDTARADIQNGTLCSGGVSFGVGIRQKSRYIDPDFQIISALEGSDDFPEGTDGAAVPYSGGYGIFFIAGEPAVARYKAHHIIVKGCEDFGTQIICAGLIKGEKCRTFCYT